MRVISLTPAIFHLPEAVNQVSRTYGEAPIVPRGPRIKPLLDNIRNGMKRVLGAPNHEPILLTGTGSTSMAAVLGSCLHPDERLLVIRNGAYGDRILEFAKTLRQPIIDLEMPYGEKPDLSRVTEILSRNEADAVAMAYGATSTCTLNPLPELAAITKRFNKKLLVDGVSAIFVEPMDLDAWGVAALMGSCNKGLHAHPNLSVALVRTDLLAEMERIPPRAPSLELWKIWRSQVAGMHPYTIDTLSLSQVAAALDFLEKTGGVPARHETYAKRLAILRPGYEKLGLTIARWDGVPLQSIGTSVQFPPGKTYQSMADRLATEEVDGHAFEIYTSQGKLSNKLFRVFNMGEYPLEVYEIFSKALARVI